jgi:hypothetical protein
VMAPCANHHGQRPMSRGPKGCMTIKKFKFLIVVQTEDYKTYLLDWGDITLKNSRDPERTGVLKNTYRTKKSSLIFLKSFIKTSY